MPAQKRLITIDSFQNQKINDIVGSPYKSPKNFHSSSPRNKLVNN
jgi:hypothetical protein